MENPFSRLLKVLSLERKQGYRNKAVIGGLDKFASRWETDARATQCSSTLVGEIVALMIGYPSVEDPGARERIIDQIVRRAREAETMVTSGPVDTQSRTTGAAQRPPRPGLILEQGPAKEAGDSEERSQSPGAGSRADTWPGGQPVASRNVPLGGKPGGRPAPVEGEPGRTDSGPARAKPGFGKPERGTGSSNGPQDTEPQAVDRQIVGAEQAQPEGNPVVSGREPQVTEDEPDSLDGWLSPEQPAGSTRVFPPGHDVTTVGPVEEESAADYHGPEGWQPTTGEMSEPPEGDLTRPAEARSRQRLENPPVSSRGLEAPVTRLPSIGPSIAEKLAKLGVHTVRDMLYLLPRRYDDYSQLRTIDRLRYGDEVTVIGTVWQLNSRPLGEGRKMTTAVIGDGSGEIEATWFNPYIDRQLHPGKPYVFSGKIDSYRGQLQLRNPAFEPLDTVQIHTGRLVPIYPSTEGLSERWLRKVMRSTVTAWAGSVPDLLPAAVRQEWNLFNISAALEQIHFPENAESLNAARRRLSFEEFFFLQLGVLRYRQQFRDETARPLQVGEETLAPYLAALPFAMTGAQRRVLGEIAQDLGSARPMSRLLQGDVGSGKTAVAAAVLWAAVVNGTQGAIMAPTEILAEQHARSFGKLFAGLTRPGSDQPVRIALLTGRQRKAEREEILAALAEGQIDIAVGTHALIQEDVNFRELAVAVVDEQHRFGVEQRAALRQKGLQPHMLVMSATPIPRSLALTIYGDLDVSVIDEMPAGRTPIKTKWLTSTYRERGYTFIRRQVAEGRQCFIIYPLVEESDRSEAKAAVEEHARLQSEIFPNLRVGLLHGRMKGDEKDDIMRTFADGELQILVATSVVEVGIDVPNATVIMIEGAERFGLAQLHQFRGRVGRGAYPSYCILISDAGEGESQQRLEALESNIDGFALAQIDLELRGPGDFLGTRQSGLPPLQMAQLTDLRTLEDARSAAEKIFARDPGLDRPEHRVLVERVAEFWRGAGDVS